MNKFTTTVLLALLVTRLPMATASGENPSLAAQVDSIFAAVNNHNSPGCAVGVIHNGEFVHRAGYGMANLELNVALNPDSIFRIGSVSKQFTAAAVLLLAQDGLIDLDEDIRLYLPELVDYGQKVTVRSMLGHVSGLPDYESELVTGESGSVSPVYKLRSVAGGPFRMGNEDYLSIDEFYDVAKRIGLRHQPMTHFEYSNLAYFLFSMLVEEVSGQSLRQYAQERIFAPLGMNNSFFSDDGLEIIKNRATGYTAKEGGGFNISMTNLYWVGDGGVHTSINDFIKWERNFSHPRIGENPLAFIQAMNTPNSPIEDEGELYANGQSVRQGLNGKVFSHSGWWLGYASHFIRFPEHKISVATFCNDDTQEPEKYAEKIANLLLERSIAQANSAPSSPLAR